MRAALLALNGAAAAHAGYTSSHPQLASFSAHHPAFAAVAPRHSSITLLYNASEPLFHEGAVYVAATDTLLVSSNRLPLPPGHVDASTSNQTIKLTAAHNVSSPDPAAVTLSPLSTDTITLPNGGTLDARAGGGVLWCAQGSKTTRAGIFAIPDPVGAPNTSVPLVTDFFGRPFNGPNDVATTAGADGGATVWFTDVDYAHAQGLRRAPQLPNQVYRFDTATGTTRAAADGLAKPNGLAFDRAGAVLYVTDASADAADNPTGFAHIYAWDVAGAFLRNKRLFAFAPLGVPDGIKVDAAGRVWAGTGGGVVVWDAEGTCLGEIRVVGGAANFGFGRDERTVFVLGEKLLWRVQLG